MTLSTSLSPTVSPSPTVTHSETPTISESTSFSATISFTPTGSPTISYTPSPLVSTSVGGVFNVCPAMCSLNGDCTATGCVCYNGWTGSDCSKMVVACPEATLSGYSPCDGSTLLEGAAVTVGGSCFTPEDTFLCAFTPLNGTLPVLRFPAQFACDYGIECVVPADLLDILYLNRSEQCEPYPAQYVLWDLYHVGVSNITDAMLSSGDGLASPVFTATYRVDACGQDADCDNGGRCYHGQCACEFGWCGSRCSVSGDNVCSLPTEVRYWGFCPPHTRFSGV